jgi:hypothetical protein
MLGAYNTCCIDHIVDLVKIVSCVLGDTNLIYSIFPRITSDDRH